MNRCRFCDTALEETFCNLGLSPLSNRYLTEEQLKEPEPRYPLHVHVCSTCLLVQLPALHPPEAIFSEYAYFSSYSSSWLAHAERYAQRIKQHFLLPLSAHVIEIASNDGYLLHFFQKMHYNVLGIEPAQNVANVARSRGIPTLVSFFSHSLAQEMGACADLLIANNVLAHVPDLNDFVAGLKRLLKPTGLLTLEFPHLLHLIQQRQFDTIYHEHFSYFSFLAAQKIFAAHGLEIFDVEPLATHGGSLRLYVRHSSSSQAIIASSVTALVTLEKQAGLAELAVYRRFAEVPFLFKEALWQRVEAIHKEGKWLAGYGAPAKGNTLLNFCGLTPATVPFTVDKNLYKQGKHLPGSHIPIFPPAHIFSEKPDYILILPWNWKEEIMEQMQAVHQWGGRFLIPIPELQLL